MERTVDLKEISDGKLYGLNDMAKVCADHCRGCSACCYGRGDTITLDPLDVYYLKINLGRDFGQLMEHGLTLSVAEGVIRPSIMMTEGENARCVFLDRQGRCGIHAFRPGLCRIFPLGRVYEETGIKYILLTGECVRENRTKEKVRRWIDVPDVQAYEKFLTAWHGFLKEVREVIAAGGDDAFIKNLNLYVLQKFYVEDPEGDFYQDFYSRLEAAGKILRGEA